MMADVKCIGLTIGYNVICTIAFDMEDAKVRVECMAFWNTFEVTNLFISDTVEKE